jgi:hypothetical protein
MPEENLQSDPSDEGPLRNLVAQTHGLLKSLPTSELAPFLDVWPQSPRWRTVRPCSQAVARRLPVMVANAPHFSARLITAVHRASALLAWRQTYTAKDIDARFLDNYGWCELAGQHGILASERLACGFLLLGPHTVYPRHLHEAEELYVPLAGVAAWQQGAGKWQDRPPGTLIHHESLEPHAMRTAGQPLLAVYLWRGPGLTHKSRLENLRQQ